LEEPQLEQFEQILVPIQSGGSRPPFFCVHGFGGGVIGYADLAKALGPDQPFYGLQAFGLDGNGEIDRMVEVMGNRYIGAMRRLQPYGPYYVGGYCFGGVVAFEMARQLEEAGEKCALVAILEGYAPRRFQERTTLYHPGRFMTIWHNIPYWTNEYFELGGRRIRSRARVKFRQTNKRLRRRLGLQGSDLALEDLLEVDLGGVSEHQRQMMVQHMQALSRYSPGRFNGRVTVFRARGQTISSALFGSQDPTHGWGTLALGGVDVKEVAGGHGNIHMQPHVQSLAAALSELLQRQAPL
jgi:thioesterase domain-containing protein